MRRDSGTNSITNRSSSSSRWIDYLGKEPGGPRGEEARERRRRDRGSKQWNFSKKMNARGMVSVGREGGGRIDRV